MEAVLFSNALTVAGMTLISVGEVHPMDSRGGRKEQEKMTLDISHLNAAGASTSIITVAITIKLSIQTNVRWMQCGSMGGFVRVRGFPFFLDLGAHLCVFNLPYLAPAIGPLIQAIT